ncbi:hypothetical protein OF381_00205 [Mannheimia haemolytica]
MAKYQMMKLPGGVLSPASEADEESLKALKNHELYDVEINLKINPVLHRKMFSFSNFVLNTGVQKTVCRNSRMKRHSLMSFVRIYWFKLDIVKWCSV